MPRIIDSPIRTSPVVNRMALPRLPILHLPGTYSGAKIDRLLQTVTSFIWALRHIDWQRWRAFLLLLRNRPNLRPRPLRTHVPAMVESSAPARPYLEAKAAGMSA